ncbi:MAG TPA: RNB domain-containing ribonuclease [Terriglobales bacterium]|nr:RNB domain-containing ribonuclease [Terriglobales bacterium]
MISESAVLRHLSRQPKQSAGYKQLVRELGLRGDDRQRLSELLAGMVGRGQLLADSERFSLPKAAASRNQITGRLSMHRDGYGFVIPDRGQGTQFHGDVFINPQAIGNAMHGDRVLVELGSIRDEGRAEGRIVRVVGRAHPTVVGTFHYGRRYDYVVPIDERITQDVIIPQGAEFPNAKDADDAKEPRRRKTDSPHRVLGEEAKKRLREWTDLDGVVVDVEITDWPSPTQNPKGRVVEILGYEDDFGVDVEIIIRKHHLPHRFPAEVLEEAQDVPDIIPARELKHRRDYRDLPIVTIDGESAHDFDDAVYVEQLANGNYQLQVHIADVAHYVTQSSALDDEARLRGNSVYFPDRAVPMLPVELSTNICSLRPNVDRLVMSCTMEIDHQGEIISYELNPGVIRSAARMTYTDVNAILEGDVGLRQRYAYLVENFERMRDLAKILNRKRVKRGAIDFDMPEPEIEFDEFGLMRSITRSERNFAHRLIEEFMLSANECVASYLEEKGVASLYRIHEKPDPRKVSDFENIAATFGYSLGVGALPVKRFSYTDDRRPRRREGGRGRGGQQRRGVEIPEDVHITPRMYQKLTQKLAGKPEERILSYLMLRSLKQARYSEHNEGHFALAAPTYTHFTSPIRRYPDLIIHRILKEVLREELETVRSTGASVGGGLRAVRLGQRPGPASSSAVPTAHGKPAASEMPSPWSKRSEELRTRKSHDDGGQRMGRGVKKGAKHADAEIYEPLPGPISEDVLHEIAEECSNSERRADEAERELMEWKKVKFMADRVGEDFEGLIISVTKFGFFVELTDMFIEGLVPLSTLRDDRYFYNDDTKQIIGSRSKKTYGLGDKLRVLVDRIDPVERKINFAVVEDEPSRAQKKHRKRG